MRAVIQRVTQASVSVAGECIGSIEQGLLILLGVHHDDTQKECLWMAKKLANLRIFTDDAGKMNLSLQDIGGGALVISQFTLYGDCSTGRRPSFTDPAPPEKAEPLYEFFVEELKKSISHVNTGKFGAKMAVSLINDGPVTFVLETNA